MITDKNVLPEVVSREQWLKKRKELLEKEKKLTQLRDMISTDRRRLPMVKIEKDYLFEGVDGEMQLLDLFERRQQLIIYHFMFDPEWEEGCSSCSAWADHIARGHLTHLNTRTTTLALVSRAPFTKLKSFKERMGWAIPWYSSHGSDFNYDYHATTDGSVTPVIYNYRDKATLEHLGQDYHVKGEQPGISCFLRVNDEVYHTYSTYGRGMETVGGTNYFLDLTALGRQEEWEEPKSRATGLGASAGNGKIKYPDEYDN